MCQLDLKTSYFQKLKKFKKDFLLMYGILCYEGVV